MFTGINSSHEMISRIPYVLLMNGPGSVSEALCEIKLNLQVVGG
jgi:hypothetical protein